MTVERSFLSDDITIRYADTEAGTPIVLIHGFSANHEMWSVFPDLEGFRLI